MDTIDYVIISVILILFSYLMYLKCDISLDLNEHLLIISIGLLMFGIVVLIVDINTVNSNNQKKEFLEESSTEINEMKDEDINNDLIDLEEPENGDTNIEIELNDNNEIDMQEMSSQSFNETNIDLKKIEDVSEQDLKNDFSVNELIKCDSNNRENKNYGYSFMPPCEWGEIGRKIENEKECNVCSNMNKYSSDYLVLENNFYNKTTLPPTNKKND